MATIYLVKDGPRPSTSSAGTESSLNEVTKRLEKYACRYIGLEPRALNERERSETYQRVVIEVLANDGANSKFPKVGFYIVENLDAAQADFLLRA
jgi:hypothetical protein